MTTSNSSPAISSSSSHLHITTTSTSNRSTRSHSHSPRSSGGGGGGGSTNQACAACKYQRRKCNPDCPLAPYFPADQQRRFLNAHRLFGVSNILKTLRGLDPSLCPDAMRSLIFQAEARALDPVGGCCRIILDLERQLEVATAELSAVLHHLALCRQAAGVANAPTASATLLPNTLTDACTELDVASSDQPLLLNAEQEVVDALYTNDEADAILQADHHGQDHQSRQEEDPQQQQQQLYDYFYYDATTGDDESSKASGDDRMQHYDSAGKVEAAPGEAVGVVGLAQQLQHHCQIEQQEYQMKAPLVDVFDMRQDLTMEVNRNVNVQEEQEEAAVAAAVKDGINMPAAAQMAESSQCRLGLGFSSF